MIARMKVKAGVRLLIIEARVGELYAIPVYPRIRKKELLSPTKKKKVEIQEN